MLKERRDAARKVAEGLFSLENAIDAALGKAAEFIGALPAARAEAKLSAMVGQEAFASAAGALTLLVEARAKVLEAHRHLEATKIQVGLREVSVGDLLPKPKVSGSEAAPLRVVA